jgi:flagellar hook assembly protein FlgD
VPADVSLDVFDVGGRLVRRVHRGWLAAGPHQFEWDGSRGNGRTVPGGVYFVKLTGPASRAGTRVLRLKAR